MIVLITLSPSRASESCYVSFAILNGQLEPQKARKARPISFAKKIMIKYNTVAIKNRAVTINEGGNVVNLWAIY